MIGVDAALAILDAHRLSSKQRRIPVSEALDCILTEDLRANITVPPYPCSSMDGYAVRSGDLAEPGAQFTVIGEAPAGAPFGGRLAARKAVRIFTGGHVPEGADQIVIQENAVRSGDHVTLDDRPSPGRYVRAAGIDFRVGDLLLPEGTRMGPAEIALAAAGDHGSVTVREKPRVAILANGNELRAPGSLERPGSVVASNTHGIAALVHRWGGEVLDCGIAPDDVEAICGAVENAVDADIIVPVGGASVGEYDYMRAAFERLGLEQHIAKIAVRPGKPTWFGRLGEQRVLGLPGNPASAFVCSHLFLRALMSGAQALTWEEAVLAHDIGAEGAREAFLRARRVDGEAPGSTVAIEILPDQDSSLISPLVAADCLLRRAGKAPAAGAGESVTILPLQR